MERITNSEKRFNDFLETLHVDVCKYIVENVNEFVEILKLSKSNGYGEGAYNLITDICSPDRIAERNYIPYKGAINKLLGCTLINDKEKKIIIKYSSCRNNGITLNILQHHFILNILKMMKRITNFLSDDYDIMIYRHNSEENINILKCII